MTAILTDQGNQDQVRVRLTYREKVPVSAMQEILSVLLREKLTGWSSTL